MSSRVRKYTIGLLILILIATIPTWLLSVNGTLCMVRTGEVNLSSYADKETFKSEVSRIHTETVSAVTRAFDSSTGFFLYSASPDGTVHDLNNDIRQLLASRVLALESVSDDSLRTIHEENLRAIMSEWYREEGKVGYVVVDEKSKLGANALLLRLLVASPLFDTYKEEAKALVRGIALLQNEDGSFEPWFLEPSYEYNKDYLLTFYSGEAILALLEYEAKTGDMIAFQIAKNAQDFYLDRYVTRMNEHYYPAYVPWHTMSLTLLYKKTKEERYRDAIFTLTDKLLELLDTEEFIGRFYDPATPEYGSPHASSDAVYTEGLAFAYRIAEEEGDTLRAVRYYDALTKAFYNLERLVFTPRWYRIFDDWAMAERLEGGVRTGHCDMRIRIDSTAHTADALKAIQEALK